MPQNMDEIFRELERAGKTDVNNLMQWMKESKVLQSANEDKARELFNDVNNKQKVELDKFKDILAKIAAEQHQSADQLSKQLAAEIPKFIDALTEGLNAFKKALK